MLPPIFVSARASLAPGFHNAVIVSALALIGLLQHSIPSCRPFLPIYLLLQSYSCFLFSFLCCASQLPMVHWEFYCRLGVIVLSSQSRAGVGQMERTASEGKNPAWTGYVDSNYSDVFMPSYCAPVIYFVMLFYIYGMNIQNRMSENCLLSANSHQLFPGELRGVHSKAFTPRHSLQPPHNIHKLSSMLHRISEGESGKNSFRSLVFKTLFLAVMTQNSFAPGQMLSSC